jgi:hypothetical protein
VFLFNFILLETIGTPLCMQQLNWNEEKRNVPRHSFLFALINKNKVVYENMVAIFSNGKRVGTTPVQLN